jgi:hypothetical protein
VGREGKKRIRKETADKIVLADQAYEAKVKALDEQKAKEAALSGRRKSHLARKEDRHHIALRKIDRRGEGQRDKPARI